MLEVADADCSVTEIALHYPAVYEDRIFQKRSGKIALGKCGASKDTAAEVGVNERTRVKFGQFNSGAVQIASLKIHSRETAFSRKDPRQVRLTNVSILDDLAFQKGSRQV
jgi:hypothetical protein